MILLILAGITIAIVSNSNLINNAKLARTTYNNKVSEEDKTIQNYVNTTDEFSFSDSIRNNENKKNNWSGEEHLTGETYLDGKLIYEKTYYIASLPNNARKYYNIDIKNIDLSWINTQKTLFIWPNNGSVSTIPYLSGDSENTYNIAIDIVQANKICITTITDRSHIKAYVTINYTKTTDNGKDINVTELKAQ